jgi:hypothetical protein
MVSHAKFLHDHRSIIIKSVPPSDYETVKSIRPVDQQSHTQTLKAALTTNPMITSIHEKFDNRTVIISTTTTSLPTLQPWISSILTPFPYHPLCTTNETRSALGSTGGTLVQSGKYSKLFAPTRDTDTTSNDSFDPSTIISTQTPRGNVWSTGPPLNVTFNLRARSVTMHTDPTRTHGQPYNRTVYGSMRMETTNLNDEQSDDTDSSTTPLTRPSAYTADVADLVAQALAVEREDLNKRLAELERKQTKFMETTAKWEQQFIDMRKQIVDATVSGTISVLTGSNSPFPTKEDAQKQREENTNKFQTMKAGLADTNNRVMVLQQNMTLLLQRTEQLFAATHDPNITSLPRKARPRTSTPAGSPMVDNDQTTAQLDKEVEHTSIEPPLGDIQMGRNQPLTISTPSQ